MKISRFCIPDISFRESTIDLAKISAPAGALPHVSCFRNLHRLGPAHVIAVDQSV